MVALGAPAFAPGTMAAQHMVALQCATSLHRCPPTWEQSDRWPSLPRWLWAGPGLPARALPGCGHTPRPRGRPEETSPRPGWGRSFPAPPYLHGTTGPGRAKPGPRHLPPCGRGHFGVGSGHRSSQGRQRWGRRPAGYPGAPRVKGRPLCGGTTPVTAHHSLGLGSLPMGPPSLCCLGQRREPASEAKRGGAHQTRWGVPGANPASAPTSRAPCTPRPRGRCPHILGHPEPPGLAQGPELNLEAQLITAVATSLSVLARTRRHEHLTPVLPKGPQLSHTGSVVTPAS